MPVTIATASAIQQHPQLEARTSNISVVYCTEAAAYKHENMIRYNIYDIFVLSHN